MVVYGWQKGVSILSSTRIMSLFGFPWRRTMKMIVCCGFLLLILGIHDTPVRTMGLAKRTTIIILPRKDLTTRNDVPASCDWQTPTTRGGSSSTTPSSSTPTNHQDKYDDLQDMFDFGQHCLSLAQWQMLQGALVRNHQAKEFYNEGDYPHGAEFFGLAAQGFETVLQELVLFVQQQQQVDVDAPTASVLMLIDALLAQYATFVLHQAFCCFKDHGHDECIRLCTQMLGDDEKNIVAISRRPIPSAIRARAFLRRAKARLALDAHSVEALQDVKAGAFLGDAKAVALYGKCVREMNTNTIAAASKTTSTTNNKDKESSPSSFGSSSLLSSLMGMGNDDDNNGGGAFSMNPLSMLFGSGFKNRNTDNTDNNGLLLSLGSNLLANAKDPVIQERICTFCRNLSVEQLEEFLPPELANRLVNDWLANIQPKDVSRMATFGVGSIHLGRLFQKIGKVLSMYRTVFFWLLVIRWIESSVHLPIPLTGEQKKAARAAAVAELAFWKRVYGTVFSMILMAGILLSYGSKIFSF